MLKYLKEKQVGQWSIEHFEITAEEARFNNLRCAFGGERGRIDPGTYTRLRHASRGVVMSDTPVELDDLREFRRRVVFNKGARNIHINGLGLGICTSMALDAGCRVEVVEIDKDVIELVGEQLKKNRNPNLTIIHADALQWKPPKDAYYDVVWHDIWDNVCGDNIEQMKLLHRRYGSKCLWQDSWGYEELKANRRGWR